jgi:hypothetical protein
MSAETPLDRLAAQLDGRPLLFDNSERIIAETSRGGDTEVDPKSHPDTESGGGRLRTGRAGVRGCAALAEIFAAVSPWELLHERSKRKHGATREQLKHVAELSADQRVNIDDPSLLTLFRSTVPNQEFEVNWEPFRDGSENVATDSNDRNDAVLAPVGHTTVITRPELEEESGLLCMPLNYEPEDGTVMLVGFASGSPRCVALVGGHVRGARGATILPGSAVPWREADRSLLGEEFSIADHPGRLFNGATIDLSSAPDASCAAVSDPGESVVVCVVENRSHRCSVWRVVFPRGCDFDADPADVLVIKSYVLGGSGANFDGLNYPQDVCSLVDDSGANFIVADGANERLVRFDVTTGEHHALKSLGYWPGDVAADPQTRSVWTLAILGNPLTLYASHFSPTDRSSPK